MKKQIFFGSAILFACLITAAFVRSPHEDAQESHSEAIESGEVVAHLAGRMLLDARGNIQLIGYYPFLAELPSSLFSGTPSEATAYFTFRTSSFQAEIVPNGNIVYLFSIPANGATNILSVYLNSHPNQDFQNPDSFSSGQLVAQYQTERSMVTNIGSSSFDIGSIELISSPDFTFQGKTYSFRDVKTATTFLSFPATPLTGGFSPGPAVIPFGGSAIAAGSPRTHEHDEDRR